MSVRKRFGLKAAFFLLGSGALKAQDVSLLTSPGLRSLLIAGGSLFILIQALIIARLILNRRRLQRVQADLLQTRDRMARGQQIARLGAWERNLVTGKLTWTDEVYRLYGLNPGDIEPTFQFVIDSIHPEDRQRTLELIEERDRTGASRRMEYRIVRADGAVRHFSIQAERQANRRGEAVLMGTVQDVTEMREMEEQIRHAYRMESVGHLAGGLAHDFNNLLTVINGYSELLLSQMQLLDPHRPAVAEIRKAGERAAGLIRNLLAFSRKQMSRPEVLQVNDVLNEMSGLLAPMLGEHVRVRLNLSPRLPEVVLDRGHFEQSILNLAANARDAMGEGGGEFRVVTRLADSKPGDKRGWIEILIQDSGHGMDEETQRRIFDPFFTTKPTGKGTGLGLASVYGFVQQSGGQVRVTSQPGRGTVFSILLPAAESLVESRA